jgi:hypothetical protein
MSTFTELVCTVGPRATDGGRCGRPAVTTFTGRNGETFAECADHDMSRIVTGHGFAPGDRVAVTHAGIDKVGRVVKIGRTRVTVEVPTYGGRYTATLTIPAEGLRRA